MISVHDPQSGKRWEEVVKPFSLGNEYQLLYKRWVDTRRADVEKLSNGRLGYVHVRGMNDPSMRTVIEEVLGKHIDDEALIVDTRFNGGGNHHRKVRQYPQPRTRFHRSAFLANEDWFQGGRFEPSFAAGCRALQSHVVLD